MIALCTIAATAAAALAQPPTPSRYAAESLLLVRSGASPNTPGAASEANRLAVTYAQLIPQDTQVLDRVARTLGMGKREVERHLTVVNDPNTSILRVRFTADDGQVAINGARTVADALAGATPASANFNGVGLSRLPESAEHHGGAGAAIPVGILFGIGLGFGLLVLWERAAGRIEHVEDVRQLVRVPVSALDELSTEGLHAVLERWRELAMGAPGSVAVVAATPGQRSLTADVVQVLSWSLAAAEAQGGAHVLADDLRLEPAGAPGGLECAEGVAQRTDLTVLVVVAGTTTRQLEQAVTSLEDFGVVPKWVLFANHRAVANADRRGRSSIDDDAVIDARDAALI